MKTIEFKFTIVSIRAADRAKYLALASAIAEYWYCEVGGQAHDFVLDTRTDNAQIAYARKHCFQRALEAVDIALDIHCEVIHE